MKIIGLMLTWNNLEFFKCALEQALAFCDELILVEGCHSKHYPRRSTDGTCEYIETIRDLPGLKVRDFNFNGKYNHVQLLIRQEFPKKSALYEPGNWVMHWDDDMFFFNSTLPKLRTAMQKAKKDSLTWLEHHFIYNFRFCTTLRDRANCHRIINGTYLSGISTPCYPNGKRIQGEEAEGVELFHYGFVKKPDRLKARMLMSMEKGTKASEGKYEQWMNVKWNKDTDIFKSEAFIEQIRPGDGLHIYKGKHPEIVANHPWRHIKDIRRIN